MTAAYQVNAYQNNAYQTAGGVFIPAFDGCAFQFDAFQAAPCPIPPEPILNDGHDAGRKKALKKLKELEDKRIEFMRKDAEHRKMLIRHAIDPQAKAEYEARMAKLAQQGKPVEVAPAKEIDKIDKQIARMEKASQYNALIRNELNRIHYEREIHAHNIRMQIQEADDELALMLMM